ncbi:MAG: T9SS type A sorting domain-containing protein [Chloroflexia bacterium]|nr:T9SS type A sorting domain-containing protein [Chloroflexia bacterium]
MGNEGVPNVSLVFASNGLQNGADAVALYTGTAADFPNGTAVTTTNLVDALVYDTNDADDAELLVLLNAGEAQINEGEQGNSAGHSMQRIPNGEGGARNTSTYTQTAPTPGTANGGGVNPGETITILEARNAADGTTVTISGVLTVSDQFNGSAYIQDATGAIAVFDAQVHGAGLFSIGDSLTITGTRSAYNDQIQISPVSLVVNNGLPNQPIVPVDVTLSQLNEHPAQLVRVVNTTFPAPGQLLFGNSNYQVTDASGSGEIRIDADVTDIVGFAQPETCSEIIGVVGRFYEIYQLMPRVAADLPCAEKWQPSGDDLIISKDLTLDVAAWNIEWFGDEGTNSPAEDIVQKDSAKAVLLSLDADVYSVEEITDDALLAQMVSEMPGYSYVLSDATSYPNDPGDKQKVGFIYKTSTVSMVSTKVLLETVHPYYNGGDVSLLTDFPDSDKTRFFASGRLPFMMTADVTINGTTQRISFISLHARANSSTDAQARYDMRKFDVEVLKDTLDAYYANDNIIMLGDYNDDVDETVADISTTISSYEAYVNDAANYTIPTASLSANGFRSYVFSENMIDHIMVSNELNNNVIANSSRVHYEFYDSDYASTTSDHLPVSLRLQLTTLEVVSIAKTDISCNGNADGTATITLRGGFEPYTYEWSDGQTTQTAINLLAGAYDVYVTDALGANVSAQVVVGESAPMTLTMAENPTVYVGYPDAATAELSATEITGGTPDYSYEWSTGETSENIVVEPFETTVYTLTVTDANNCSVSGDVVVNVEDITCGRRGIPKVTICYKDKSFCLPVQVASIFIEYGAQLGACNYRGKKAGVAQSAESVTEVEEAFVIGTEAYPNPFTNEIKLTVISAISADIELLIYSVKGELVHSESRSVIEGESKLDLELGNLIPGTYILKTVGLESEQIRIVKE